MLIIKIYPENSKINI